MKKFFIFMTAITLSTSVLAGNMSEPDKISSMHTKTKDKHSIENILQNEDMQRLHRDMSVYGMSEAGMEARLQMSSTEQGQAYHKALEKRQKNAAG